MNLTRLLRLFFLLPVAFALTGCGDEPFPDRQASDGEVYLTVFVHVADIPNSRAEVPAWSDPSLDYLTERQSQIADEDIYVILYDKDGKILEIPDLVELPSNSPGYRTVKGLVSVRAAAVTYRVLANVAQASSFADNPEGVKTRLRDQYAGKKNDSQLCNDLLADGFNTSGKWELSSKLLPMQSAMSAEIILDHDRIEAINLYRSLAKIGIVYVPIDTTEPFFSQTESDGDGNVSVSNTFIDDPFRLTKVKIHNVPRYGALISSVVPNKDPLLQFETPFVVSATPSFTHDVEYDVSDNKILETIFVPEHFNIGADSDMFIEVYFAESSEGLVNPQSGWHKFYFTANGLKDGPELLNVIRNHSYIFTIKRIGSRLEVNVAPYLSVELNPDFGVIPPESGGS